MEVLGHGCSVFTSEDTFGNRRNSARTGAPRSSPPPPFPLLGLASTPLGESGPQAPGTMAPAAGRPTEEEPEAPEALVLGLDHGQGGKQVSRLLVFPLLHRIPQELAMETRSHAGEGASHSFHPGSL